MLKLAPPAWPSLTPTPRPLLSTPCPRPCQAWLHGQPSLAFKRNQAPPSKTFNRVFPSGYVCEKEKNKKNNKTRYVRKCRDRVVINMDTKRLLHFKSIVVCKCKDGINTNIHTKRFLHLRTDTKRVPADKTKPCRYVGLSPSLSLLLTRLFEPLTEVRELVSVQRSSHLGCIRRHVRVRPTPPHVAACWMLCGLCGATHQHRRVTQQSVSYLKQILPGIPWFRILVLVHTW